jgi:hypothetical protein
MRVQMNIGSVIIRGIDIGSEGANAVRTRATIRGISGEGNVPVITFRVTDDEIEQLEDSGDEYVSTLPLAAPRIRRRILTADEFAEEPDDEDDEDDEEQEWNDPQEQDLNVIQEIMRLALNHSNQTE